MAIFLFFTFVSTFFLQVLAAPHFSNSLNGRSAASGLADVLQQARCKLVSALVITLDRDAAATPFCSSFLSVPVSTSQQRILARGQMDADLCSVISLHKN